MNYLKTLFFVMTLFTALLGSAQDLSKHRWENRLILLISDDENNPTLKAQIAEFTKDLTGLEERKLIIYQVMPEEYKIILNGDTTKQSSKLYKTYKKTEKGFEVLLLGLDGGIKHRQSELLPLEKLYAIIDAMPMRRSEMKREKRQ